MTIATTDSGNSNSLPRESSRFDELMSQIKGNKITPTKLRDEIFNILLDNATEIPQTDRWYIFEYDPKFRDQLVEWDEYPLIYALEFKKDNLLGANMHYMGASNARLRAINNKKFPTSTLHYYIPKRADAIFFEIKESEVQLLSQLPLEKFHRNR